MKPELQQKLNTEIAEWMGWTLNVCPACGEGELWFPPSCKGVDPRLLIPKDILKISDFQHERMHDLTNYFSSLDACHEVVVRMDKAKQWMVDEWLEQHDVLPAICADAPTMASAIAYALELWDGKES